MKKSETAGEYFAGGFNCAASVLASFCEEYDLDTELALKLASGLGGGFTQGEICGAVSAAAIVVGLKHGMYIQGDLGAKANCHAKTTQFLDEFRRKHGAVICRDLLVDQPKGDDEESLKERRRFCVELVKSSADMLEELGY